MASLHKINGVLAGLRSVPLATIETYGRVLTQKKVLSNTKRGGGATARQPEDAVTVLLALLRGSPSEAARNAHELSKLIVAASGSTPVVLDHQIAGLGWPRDFTFHQAVTWLLNHYINDTTSSIMSSPDSLRIEVDRYWPSATITWRPTKQIGESYRAGWESFLGKDNARLVAPIDAVSGMLVNPMPIGFAHPLIYQRSSDSPLPSEQKAAASRKFQKMGEAIAPYDINGSEWITAKTMKALGQVFKAQITG